MEVALRVLCHEHNLSCIGVNIFDAQGSAYVSVYLHWADGECVSNSGDTFDEALASALVEMRARRRPRAA